LISVKTNYTKLTYIYVQWLNVYHNSGISEASAKDWCIINTYNYFIILFIIYFISSVEGSPPSVLPHHVLIDFLKCYLTVGNIYVLFYLCQFDSCIIDDP